MRRTFLYLVLFFLNFSAFSQTDTLAYKEIALMVQKQYAPDKRSVYFNVQYRGDTIKVESTSEAALKSFTEKSALLKSLPVSTMLLPAKALKDLTYGIVNLSVANNRSSAGHSAELMTQMLLGTPVQVLKKQGGFYLVKTPDNYLAWTDGGAVALVNEQGFKVWQNTEKIVFINDYGHAFSKPDINSTRVSDLVSGNILQLLGEEKDFVKVSYPDKRIAYIPKLQVTGYKQWVKRPNPSANAVLATAKTLLGVPYLWGGTSIKGVDCSGFTKTAYYLNGIVIPRDASQQALVGDPIDVMENDSVSVVKCLKNLKAGDLLFFSLSKARGIKGGRITHTAIYMGDGEFIQAAGMVKINSLVPTAPNYDKGQTPTLVGARRILTSIGAPEITRIDHHDWYGKN